MLANICSVSASVQAGVVTKSSRSKFAELKTKHF